MLFAPAHLCGERWNHIGDACLHINSSRESYDNAKLYCYNLSGNLASLTTSKEVEFVLDEIQKYTLQVTWGTVIDTYVKQISFEKSLLGFCPKKWKFMPSKKCAKWC